MAMPRSDENRSPRFAELDARISGCKELASTSAPVSNRPIAEALGITNHLLTQIVACLKVVACDLERLTNCLTDQRAQEWELRERLGLAQRTRVTLRQGDELPHRGKAEF